MTVIQALSFMSNNISHLLHVHVFEAPVCSSHTSFIMPTRIVLQEAAPVVPRSPPSHTPLTTPRLPRTPIDAAARPRATTPYSFRKSIETTRTTQESDNWTLGSDIRSSPRMSCYLYSLLCSAVMLVSIVQFYFKNGDSISLLITDGESSLSQWGVYLYKLWGAFAVSAAGVVINLLILFAHFDTFFAPEFWQSFFRDGSHGERNLIYCLMVYWMGGLYLCTSTLSVGSAQANVYFATWLAFGVQVMLYNVWRLCAGYRTWTEIVRSAPCETTYNWSVALFFSVVAALGASDTYAARDELSIYFRGKEVLEDVRELGLILAWVSTATCMLVLLGNYSLTKSLSMNCTCFEVTLDWRQFEGAFVIALLAIYGYVLFVYTGTQGIFNQPSNTYFGIWLTFFSLVLTFGTWMRENKKFLKFRIPTSQTASSSRRQSSLR